MSFAEPQKNKLFLEQAEVKYDAEVLTPDDIARGVTGLGYKCRHTRTVKSSAGKAGYGGGGGGGEGGEGSQRGALEVEVTGMSCTSCSGKVDAPRDRLQRVDAERERWMACLND